MNEIVVDEENQNFVVEDGVLFTHDMDTLLIYPANKHESSYTVPKGAVSVR